MRDYVTLFICCTRANFSCSLSSMCETRLKRRAKRRQRGWFKRWKKLWWKDRGQRDGPMRGKQEGGRPRHAKEREKKKKNSLETVTPRFSSHESGPQDQVLHMCLCLSPTWWQRLYLTQHLFFFCLQRCWISMAAIELSYPTHWLQSSAPFVLKKDLASRSWVLDRDGIS